MPRRARVSPERILAAAAAEFAEHGFAGARVDRIAARARVNKAMLYYHFASKAGIYRELLRQMFSGAAARLRAIGEQSLTPAEKIDRAIAGIAAHIADNPALPAIMLRELAEGGRHLDRETLTALGAVPQAFAAIVHEGIAGGTFRNVHPVFAYFSVLAPVIFFLAAAPIRKRVSDLHVIDLRALTPDEFVRQMQETVRLTLRRSSTPASKRTTS